MFAVYGKRTQEIYYKSQGVFEGPDKTFRALDANGERTVRKADAITFNTSDDAQAWIDKYHWRPGVELEIRKL